MLWLLSLRPRDEALSCLRPADYDMQPSKPIPAQIGFACADRQASLAVSGHPSNYRESRECLLS